MQKQIPEAPAALAVTIPDAARALSLGRSSVYKMIASGDLRVVRVGRRTLVPMTALRALVDPSA